ncbi:hypothetical protein IE81DRAFT_242568 [Ceraceosorus guamensis]|uniref:Uncharacterized protein n=1 Tax=Ceraceosorus guamensis TaxID=1522189 RepID=A0A316W5J0_9BASI|nr:hypothetical protein IE81DRAFT_242568 [Ceraceosorus guamensis]PWN44904.1 hypothetical protein IE81DRAFT_242568 [Ceraceosorus guamensis]
MGNAALMGTGVDLINKGRITIGNHAVEGSLHGWAAIAPHAPLCALQHDRAPWSIEDEACDTRGWLTVAEITMQEREHVLCHGCLSRLRHAYPQKVLAGHVVIHASTARDGHQVDCLAQSSYTELAIAARGCVGICTDTPLHPLIRIFKTCATDRRHVGSSFTIGLSLRDCAIRDARTLHTHGRRPSLSAKVHWARARMLRIKVGRAGAPAPPPALHCARAILDHSFDVQSAYRRSESKSWYGS